MPFEKVDTQVDFPAQERAGGLQFWQTIDAFERLRQQNKGGPQLVLSRRSHHGQQSDGRAPRLGTRTYKDAFQRRYHAMLGCELRSSRTASTARVYGSRSRSRRN